MKSNSILMTQEMINRIKELQKEKNIKNYQMAKKLLITHDKYKNYLRPLSPNKNRYIEYEIIDRLHDLFNCTIDYLLCESTKPKFDRNNKEITKPFKSNSEKERNQINVYLYNHYELMHSLYFFLFELPNSYITKRDKAIDGFVSLMKMVEEVTPFGKDYISEAECRSMLEALKGYDRDLVECMVKYTRGKEYLSERKYSKALFQFLETILMIKSEKVKSKNAQIIIDACKELTSCDNRRTPLEIKELISDIYTWSKEQKGKLVSEIEIPKELLNRIEEAVNKHNMDEN